MDKERVSYLYQRHLDKVLTGAELAELRILAKNPEFSETLEDLTENLWDFDEQGFAGIEPIKARSFYEYIVLHPQQKRTFWLWPRILTASAAVIAIAFGVWFYTIKVDSLRNISGSDQVVVNDVAPGKVGATLTLANGKKIKLTNAANGELAKEAGVMITKSEDGQIVYEIQHSAAEPNKINTLTTAKGETYRLRLPDGSLVWLNAASSLTYSASLIERGKRMIRLRGEGYFEIFKDKAHPFVVKVKKSDNLPEQEITVLGTHFNVKAYDDEGNIKTTLLEGSVRIATPSTSLERDGKKEQFPGYIILKPNEQSIVTSANQIKVNQADIEEAIAWKNGHFSFKDENIQTIMQSISRWYNVEVSYEGNITKDGFNGKISRFKNINQVLKMLEDTKLVHFKVEGRRVIVRE